MITNEYKFPSSRRAYVAGKLYPDIRVSFREISQSPTRLSDGTEEENHPVMVYDASGPWGDPDQKCEVTSGLPALRRPWILARGDVQEYEGRPIAPADDGYISAVHAAKAAQKENKGKLEVFPGLKRQPLRASKAHPATQLWYARKDIITPEMEYIAIRENLGREQVEQNGHHPGNGWAQGFLSLSRPSLSVMRSRGVGRSSLQTSITPNWSQ